MNTFNRDAFLQLGRSAFKVLPVDLPAFGGRVFVRELSVGEAERWSVEHERAGVVDFHARATAAFACDESGAPLFTAADVPALSKRFTRDDLAPIVDAALRVNGMAKDSLDDARKNSETTPTNG